MTPNDSIFKKNKDVRNKLEDQKISLNSAF
jgi:hypothetical protein